MIIIKVLLYYIVNYKWQILFYSAGAAECITFTAAVFGSNCSGDYSVIYCIMMFILCGLAIVARFNMS